MTKLVLIGIIIGLMACAEKSIYTPPEKTEPTEVPQTLAPDPMPEPEAKVEQKVEKKVEKKKENPKVKPKAKKKKIKEKKVEDKPKA